MRRFRNFIAKYHEDIGFCGVCSLFFVNDSTFTTILMYLPVPITIFAISYWGKRINDKREERRKKKDKES